jgi:hypothetical protein
MARRTAGAIPASKVRITRVYLVDCDVCHEGIEPESGGLLDRREAERVKQRHLDGHRTGDYWGED